MRREFRRRLAGVLIATGLLVGSGATGTTSGFSSLSSGTEPTRCWHGIYDDWKVDGDLDRRYSLRCYDDALRSAPDDVRRFGDFVDEVRKGRSAGGRPCWQRIYDDWKVDGSLDRRYSLRCYEDALRRAPDDILWLGDFAQDVKKAKNDALRPRGGNR
jgi:hypothetical protein